MSEGRKVHLFIFQESAVTDLTHKAGHMGTDKGYNDHREWWGKETISATIREKKWRNLR
jgi:hypothetical protein